MRILIVISVFFLYQIDNATILQFELRNSDKVSITKDSIVKYLEEWKIDKFGCKGIRSDKKLELIIKEYKLDSCKSIKVLEILGDPDIESQYKDFFVYCYYYDSYPCFKGKLTDSSDYGYTTFYFQKMDSTLKFISGGYL